MLFSALSLATLANNHHCYCYFPLYIASSAGRSDIVELLVKYGADLDRSVDGLTFQHTALIVAAAKGHKETIEVLLKNGANKSYVAPDGISAMSAAKIMGHDEIVRVLQEHK